MSLYLRASLCIDFYWHYAVLLTLTMSDVGRHMFPPLIKHRHLFVFIAGLIHNSYKAKKRNRKMCVSKLREAQVAHAFLPVHSRSHFTVLKGSYTACLKNPGGQTYESFKFTVWPIFSLSFWLWFSGIELKAEAYSSTFLLRNSKRHKPAVVDSLNQNKVGVRKQNLQILQSSHAHHLTLFSVIQRNYTHACAQKILPCLCITTSLLQHNSSIFFRLKLTLLVCLHFLWQCFIH